MVEHQPSKLDTWVRFPSPAFFMPWLRNEKQAEKQIEKQTEKDKYRMKSKQRKANPEIQAPEGKLTWTISWRESGLK